MLKHPAIIGAEHMRDLLPPNCNPATDLDLSTEDVRMGVATAKMAIAWMRDGKPIYHIHPTIAETLRGTLTPNLPWSSLQHLPTRVLCLDTGSESIGFYFISCDGPDTDLVLAYVAPDGKYIGSELIPAGWQLRSGSKEHKPPVDAEEAECYNLIENASSDLLERLFFLAATNCDITPPSSSDEPQKKKLGSKKLKKFQTRLDSKPQVHLAGYRLGSALEAAIHRQSAHDGPCQPGSPKAPHLRRAHWHSYWCGPRDKQTIRVKWLPPMLIHGGFEENPVIHNVITQETL